MNAVSVSPAPEARSGLSLSSQRSFWIALLFIAAAAIIVFWGHIFNHLLFVGNSDRLDTYFNMRLMEYDSLKTYGRASTWSPQMFGGFAISALHWMYIGKDPIAYFLQLFPREQIFEVLGYVAAACITAAGVTAFLYIRDVCGNAIAAVAGAVAYMMSVYSIHRIAQVDNAHFTVIIIPLALLFIRQIRPWHMFSPFVGLSLAITALVYWGFLQEAAYAYIFFTCYALYRAGAVFRADRRAALSIIFVFSSAAFLSLLFTAPRLITLAQEFSLLTRTGNFQTTEFIEVLRLFHEGIFGRTYEEMLRLSNTINVHEGLQLTSSAMLVLFVCFGILRPRTSYEATVAIIYAAVLVAVVLMLTPLDRIATLLEGNISSALFWTVTVVAIFFLFVFRTHFAQRWIAYNTKFALPDSNRRPDDVAFHLTAFLALLLLITIPEGTKAVYLLFAKIEFLHGRLSVLILLPLCTLFSVYLSAFADRDTRDIEITGLAVTKLALASVAGGCSALLIHGPLLENALAFDAFKLSLRNHATLLPIAISEILATLAAFGLVLAGVRFVPSKAGRIVAFGFLAGFVVVESLCYAHFKIEGPLTATYPIPFRNHNYMNVASSIMRPPSPLTLSELRKTLEISDYRTVEINEFQEFPVMATAHLSGFWGLRSLGGYSMGPSWRLSRLPWQPGLQSSRSLHFAKARHIDKTTLSLLAALNVKYILIDTPEFYFNTDTFNRSASLTPQPLTLGLSSPPRKSRTVAGIPVQFLENPVPPLPRHFFVKSIANINSRVSVNRHIPQTKEERLALGRIFADPERLRQQSYVEGMDEVVNLDTSGDVDITYRDDFIQVRMTPSERYRFLVINELYDPAWHAFAGSNTLRVVPTNLFMRGILIPPNTDQLSLAFQPFATRWRATLVQILAIILWIAGAALFHYAQTGRMGKRQHHLE